MIRGTGLPLILFSVLIAVAGAVQRNSRIDGNWWVSDIPPVKEAASSVEWWNPAFSMRTLLDDSSSGMLPLRPEDVLSQQQAATPQQAPLSPVAVPPREPVAAQPERAQVATVAVPPVAAQPERAAEAPLPQQPVEASVAPVVNPPLQPVAAQPEQEVAPVVALPAAAQPEQPVVAPAPQQPVTASVASEAAPPAAVPNTTAPTSPSVPLSTLEEGAGAGSIAMDSEPPDESRIIHLTMLSNRKVGAGAAMESVCRNAEEPARLRFHIIGPGSPENPGADGWLLQDLAPACWDGDAELLLYSITEMTARVEQAGFSPVWKWPKQSAGAGIFSVRPAAWDYSDTHRHPFNLLRFYLAHIPPFDNLSRVIFLDDDVVIFKDVADVWEEKLSEDKIMTASCQNWVWSACDRFESSHNLSYLEVPYFGIGRITDERTVDQALCKSADDRECLPHGFLELLGNASTAINGKDNAITLESLRSNTAWNYGFNKFDLDNWRRLKITQKYADWSKLNFYYKIFPETSLAFGLGISMLVNMGRVQCLSESNKVLQGFGFIGANDMRDNSIDPSTAFGIHFNGPRKPWDKSMANPYVGFFLKYAQSSWRDAFNQKVSAREEARTARERENTTSFVLMTDPRSGSEWFMDMLDRHPELCASGEAAESSLGFPSEALIPGRYAQEAVDLVKDVKKVKSGVSFLSRGVHLLSDLEKLPKSAARKCKVKTSCAWGNIAAFVWNAVEEPSLCNGTSADWQERQRSIGIVQLPVACHILEMARRKLADGGIVSPTRVQMVEASFNVYIREQLRNTLRAHDSSVSNLTSSEQVLPCRCSNTAVITGTKVMHDWIGDVKASVAKANPWGMNYNSRTHGAEVPHYDLLGAFEELGTKVVLYTRKNFLARYVSLLAATESSIYHCTSQDCVDTATKVKVHVDVPKFRLFVKFHKGVHERNKALLQRRGIKYIELFYEDCEHDIATCYKQVTDFLGVSPAPSQLVTKKSNSLYVKTLDGGLRSHIANVDEVEKALVADGLDYLNMAL